jgi:tRNASer (uridine44-2'-O)-methyltransferase
MGITPNAYDAGQPAVLTEASGPQWTPLFWHECSFTPDMFRLVMLNLIRNPNINSSFLFRADILLDEAYQGGPLDSESPARLVMMDDFDLKTVMVRKMIPRNPQVDDPLDQTCLLYSQTNDPDEIKSLVTYIPHISSPSESPFYHPAVRGIAFLHTFKPNESTGTVSIHYSYFPDEPVTEKLQRTAMHLLTTLHKHGQGRVTGYVKRVNHDVILPQEKVQNTYARLKSTYAKDIIKGWVESTDPAKHVFEDLGIAAFLIELWAEMYQGENTFPGFVDIGCGNGLLVHILLEEGYSGWGFDARRRKSWEQYSEKAQANLKELVLIPSIIQNAHTQQAESQKTTPGVHPGTFPDGTFIISNHADELTPWTPILAALSSSPFMMIPCCSHALSGARFRAPAAKGKGASKSAYASLVSWVSKLGESCGWEMETEMLRIPSTRNTALLGRRRTKAEVDIDSIIRENGGAEGWEENAMKLVKVGPRGH